jgi:hypothetical protein
MALPEVPVAGPKANGIAAVTYTLPAHQAGDILLLCVECAESVGVTAPAGWAHTPGSPRAQGSNVTAVNVLWKRATSSAEPNPTVADPGNHQVGFAVRVRGVRTAGDPWAVAPMGDGEASGADFALVTTQSTTEPNTRVMVLIAGSADTDTDNFTSVTAPNLGSFALVQQAWTLDGNGGGIGCYSGTRATAGTIGTISGSTPVAAAVSAVTIGLVGATAPPPAPTAKWWNGTTEVAATVTWWNGTAEVPATLAIQP